MKCPSCEKEVYSDNYSVYIVDEGVFVTFLCFNCGGHGEVKLPDVAVDHCEI